MTTPIISRPVAGHYRLRSGRGTPWQPVRISEVPALDPETGEPMDRPIVLEARVGIDAADLYETWIRCCSNAITPEEYEHMLNIIRWVGWYEPDAPEARPERAVDLGTHRVILPPGRE